MQRERLVSPSPSNLVSAPLVRMTGGCATTDAWTLLISTNISHTGTSTCRNALLSSTRDAARICVSFDRTCIAPCNVWASRDSKPWITISLTERLSENSERPMRYITYYQAQCSNLGARHKACIVSDQSLILSARRVPSMPRSGSKTRHTCATPVACCLLHP